MSHVSRRGFLKGLGVTAGAAAGTRIAGREWAGPVQAATTGKAAVLSIFLDGGFNALFASADSFKPAGAFGVNDGNVMDLGNGLVVDKSTIGSLNRFARTHVAAIGNRHGSSDHGAAQRNNYSDGTRSFALQLAAAMGGDASFKAAAMGSMPPGPSPAENGVSLQLLRTVGDAITALGGRARDTEVPARKKPVKRLDFNAIVGAYPGKVGLNADLNNMNSKMAAAELMIRSGTNVVTIRDGGWDSHGDRDGSSVRTMMSQRILPPVKTFLDRITTDPELSAMNITVIIHGDFARSLPGSEHAAGTTALVIGPNVKVGTTGKMSASVALPPNTPAGKEMWSYLAALTKIARNPSGTNPHDLVL